MSLPNETAAKSFDEEYNAESMYADRPALPEHRLQHLIRMGYAPTLLNGHYGWANSVHGCRSDPEEHLESEHDAWWDAYIHALATEVVYEDFRLVEDELQDKYGESHVLPGLWPEDWERDQSQLPYWSWVIQQNDAEFDRLRKLGVWAAMSNACMVNLPPVAKPALITA